MQLLGKFLVTEIPCRRPRGPQAPRTSGMIVETEAYAGPSDRASHAFNNRRTRRTETMFCRGGTAYVYLCYGLHAMFNVVTNVAGIPHAILIRAVQPAEGLDRIMKRRSRQRQGQSLTAGPGALTQAMGIGVRHDRTDLTGSRIWIEDRGIRVRPCDIIASPRVGVAYAGPDARRPFRFRIRDNPWTSPAR